MDTLLEKSGLWGSGLVTIRGKLRDYYNECLKSAGITPTELLVFDIDGKGWSPQIADEKKDPFYLSSGGAVQFGIILTIEQMGKPVWRPHNSFERFMMDTIFKLYPNAIADLTNRSGILVEINPGLTKITDPRDLLMLESVGVTLTDMAGVMAATFDQRALVELFKRDGAWSNQEVRTRIIESSKKFGDLRFRDVLVPPIRVQGEDMAHFYSEDFGGTFVLKSSTAKETLLVVTKELEEGERGQSDVYRLSDSSLLTRLFEDSLVEIPLDFYRENSEAFEDLCTGILVSTLYSNESRSGIVFNSLTAAEKMRYAANIDEMPKEYFEIEKFRKSLEIGKEPKKLTKRMQILLMRPHRNLPVWAARVVWRLISRMTLVTGVPTISVADLYMYDKPTFFENFVKWPESRKLWAVEHLKRRGLCPAKKGA